MALNTSSSLDNNSLLCYPPYIMGAVNKCRELNPSPRSVLFCGTFINLTELSKSTGLAISTLSMIFSGRNRPSFDTSERIAVGLGMSLYNFMQALSNHIALRKPYVPRNLSRKTPVLQPVIE